MHCICWFKKLENKSKGDELGTLSQRKIYCQKTLLLEVTVPEQCTSRGRRKQEVYTYESYIYTYYNRNDNLIWDPSIKQDIMMEKAKHKNAAIALLQQSKDLICKHWIQLQLATWLDQCLVACKLFCQEATQVTKEIITKTLIETTIYSGGLISCY